MMYTQVEITWIFQLVLIGTLDNCHDIMHTRKTNRVLKCKYHVGCIIVATEKHPEGQPTQQNFINHSGSHIVIYIILISSANMWTFNLWKFNKKNSISHITSTYTQYNSSPILLLLSRYDMYIYILGTLHATRSIVSLKLNDCVQ